jgi:uncharacterized protein (TIGR03790 family)
VHRGIQGKAKRWFVENWLTLRKSLLWLNVMPPMKRSALSLWVLLCTLAVPTTTHSALTPGNVLVVYNDPGDLEISDGFQIWDYYKTKPKRQGVLGLNLDDADLYSSADAPNSLGSISYQDFKTKIRDKIWEHIEISNLESTVRVIVLTKGIPHQIQDYNDGAVRQAADVQNLRDADNATLVSVDSELTLIKFDLSEGEMDGGMDSSADNFVLNPYFESTTSIPYSSAPNINFSQLTALDKDDNPLFHYWEMRKGPFTASPGELYLTARLDGNSLIEVKTLIDRCDNVRLDSKRFSVILDETMVADSTTSPSNFDGSDYTDTDNLLSPTWTNLIHDKAANFLVGRTSVTPPPGTILSTVHDPVAFLSSYGANHPGGSHMNWIFTYQGQLPHGAIYNAYESYNGMQFGKGDSTTWSIPTSSAHGQVADWVEIGGTFALGHVWEPFVFAVGKNSIITDNFYNNGLTWVESAWSGIEVISWQNTVIGDPLATVTILDNLPQLSLSITFGPDYSSEVLEDDASEHTITITSDIPVVGDLDVNLSFLGATVGDDFSADIAGYTTGTAATVTILDGSTQVSFTLTVVDDSDDEGLEILAVSLAESSLDANGDGYGESYGFLVANASASIPIADSPFAWWNLDQFGELVAADADTDGDGLDNLWEYFLVTDPNIAASPGNLIDALIHLNAAVDGNTLTFDTPNTFPADVKLNVESNATLNELSWAELVSRTGIAPWLEPSGTDLTVITLAMIDSITLTTSDPVRGFCRFKLLLQPHP